MEKRSTSGTGIINALLLAVVSLLAVAAIALPSARAGELSAADVCDREAGSIFDLQRNQAFPAVATEDIRIGVALSACREAYNQKSGARAEFQLARVLDKAGQKAQSLRILGEAAEHGHALAMTNYAVLLGEQGDTTAEFALNQKAAAAGNILAAYNLGVSYRDGMGTPVNGKLAIEWFERASLAGDDVAAFNLAVMLDEGKLVPEDNGKAAKFYRLAADRGNVDAMVNLGLMLGNGEGIAKDIPAARNMFRKAANEGDTFAERKLAELDGNDAFQTAMLGKTSRIK
ncbi:Secretory immunoglobulin A-binding protein EsiB [Ensifer sesbaniae]|nr:Secretory immunoglobulin A-binding protein EsiB [Ensifer sesbaniae]